MRLLRSVLLASAVATLALSACKSPCRQLSEKLCECEPNTLEKEACLREVSQAESRNEVGEADNAVCAELLDKCDCRLIDTAEGKRNCGLAR